MALTFRKRWTFWQRYKREVVFFGIPVVCLDLIGMPVLGRGIVLAIVVPATLVGLLAYTTVVEHSIISALSEEDKGKSSR